MLTPLDTRQMMLAVRAARAFTRLRRLAYAQVAPDLTVTLTSENFFSLLSDPGLSEIHGQSLGDLLWEFVGLEETLRAVLRGEMSHYQLGHVNREQPDGSIAYVTLSVLPLDEELPERGLLLLVEDITEVGRLEQRLVQATNELSLMQTRLNKGE